MAKGAYYEHDLGKGIKIRAYSVDPSIDESGLRAFIADKDGKADPVAVNREAAKTRFIGKFSSIEDLDIDIGNKLYRIPEKFELYRKAVQFQCDSTGKYNGPVIIAGELVSSREFFMGGYYDYIATKPEVVPSRLESELNVFASISDASPIWGAFQKGGYRNLRQIYEELQRSNTKGIDALAMLPQNSLFWKANCNSEKKNNFVKAGGLTRLREVREMMQGAYPAGKNMETLFEEWGINLNQRAKYLGIGYLLLTDNGKQFNFVITGGDRVFDSGLIGLPGSTPNPPFQESSFEINKYLKRHIAEELNEEFNLDESEISTDTIHLFDSTKEMACAIIKIKTPISSPEIVERIHGKPDVIGEHSILCSIQPEGIPELIKRFPLHPIDACMLQQIEKGCLFLR